MIECALQGEHLLDKLTITLKNFITLDVDSVLSLFLFRNFSTLDGLANSKFISILSEVVVGSLVNTQVDSFYKFEFIQKVIVYLLDQLKSLDVSILNQIMEIFNHIWSCLPVLDKEWGKTIVEQTSKSGEYNKYMRIMVKKRKQEYQFYKLYESIQDYATEYFEVLKRVMNLGIPEKDNIVKAFWFLLNAASNET